MVAGWRFPLVMRSPWEDLLAERETRDPPTWQRALPFCRLHPRSGVMLSGARHHHLAVGNDGRCATRGRSAQAFVFDGKQG
jgi:hypothetical protein